MGKGARWILTGKIGLLAFVGVGASAAHYLQEPYNPAFLDFPTVVALHVLLGGYLALAPFQFVGHIRSRHLGYHRWAERAVISLFGILFLFALIRGFLHVRAGRVALHREWMIRAFAIGLAIATARLIFFPVLLITMVDPTEERFGTLLVVALAVAFVLQASVAELWICVTRRSGALTADGVKAE